MRAWFFPAVLAVLSGCGPEFVANTLYPDGEVFQFRSSDGDSLMKYACAASGPGGATAKIRAAAAHRHFERENERFAQSAAQGMIDDISAGKSDAGIAAKLDRDSDAFGDNIFNDLERRFACAMIDVTD